MRLDGFDLTTGASIGIAIFPGDGAHRDQLVSNTDLAMYRAKGSLSESICFYESRMDEAERERRGPPSPRTSSCWTIRCRPPLPAAR